MSSYDILLYNIDKSLCLRISYKELNILKYFFSNNIITIINYLTTDIYYYNNKISISSDNDLCIVKYIICRFVSACVSCYNKKETYALYIINYYNILLKEYKIKNLKDKCIKELIKYVIFRQYIKLYKKNDLCLDIHHIMLLNFKFAKKLGYEFIPKGFKDS
jgi:hypothetical protein